MTRDALLSDLLSGLRRLDPAWCVLRGEEQLSDEELDELIGRLEDEVLGDDVSQS